MSDLYLKSIEADKYNSRGDFFHLDIDYRSNALRLDFDGSTCVEDKDGNLIIGLYVTQATGITAGSKTIPLPMAMCFTVHKAGNKYELFDMDEYKKNKDAKAAKKQIDTQPLELLILKAIEAQKIDFAANLAGFVSIASSPNDDSFLSGDFPIEKYKFCMVAESTAKHLDGKKIDPNAASGGASGGGYKAGQTELAKLYDRQNVIKTVSNAWLNDKNGTNFDIKNVDDRTTYQLMSAALQDSGLRDYLSLICGVSLPNLPINIPDTF